MWLYAGLKQQSDLGIHGLPSCLRWRCSAPRRGINHMTGKCYSSRNELQQELRRLQQKSKYHKFTYITGECKHPVRSGGVKPHCLNVSIITQFFGGHPIFFSNFYGIRKPTSFFFLFIVQVITIFWERGLCARRRLWKAPVVEGRCSVVKGRGSVVKGRGRWWFLVHIVVCRRQKGWGNETVVQFWKKKICTYLIN